MGRRVGGKSTTTVTLEKVKSSTAEKSKKLLRLHGLDQDTDLAVVLFLMLEPISISKRKNGFKTFGSNAPHEVAKLLTALKRMLRPNAKD